MAELNFAVAPVRQRRLRSFAAGGPRPGGTPERWDINLYRIVPEAQVIAAEWQAIKPGAAVAADPTGEPLPGGRALARNEAIGIEPSEGGRFRILPRGLQQAWSAGEVPDAQLPSTLSALEPRLRRSDFFDAGRNGFLWAGLVLFLVMAAGVLVSAWAFLPSREHASKYVDLSAFLREQPAERNVILGGMLRATPIAPLDRASLRAPAGLKLPPDLDTVGTFDAADGSKRLIIYGKHNPSVTSTGMVAYGPVIRADRIGLDARAVAARANADPTLVLIEAGTWSDGADPTGLSNTPWMVPGFAALFAATGLLFGFTLLRRKRRDRVLRTLVAQFAQRQRPA